MLTNPKQASRQANKNNLTMALVHETDTMSSLQIAEVTGKRHADVMRDIRNLLDQGVHQRNFALTFRVNDLANGAQRKDPYYELTKKGCLILASGYNALLREKIIDRWEQLETKERNAKKEKYDTLKQGITDKNGAYQVAATPIPLNTKKVRAALAWVEGVGDMLRLNDASKLSFLGKVANTFNLPLPDYTPSHGLLKSASELLKDCGSALNARQFNKLAMQGGYLTELSRRSTGGTEKKFKSITAKGLPYGENQVNPQNPRYTQPLWYADKFSALLQTLTPMFQVNKR